ncbi:MAG: exodeoxyribonuclease V subunit beta [Alysiella sp.]|uniref:exodeoxyribonuclease V subunit beta n=1 Tax=Alysiella sp. TaxID=1872483 RepID=UPI0026DD0EED|nr:exodeoxyribonuclease V subunit beta [Alysiella sp.]MDO4433861.1 exodeoxyribonuclease V subunit beta [Alysiella sp.]
MHSHVLNPLTLPLSGTHLIEASAGTGKTWNIAALYTRLVILEQMDVAKILVVTFTKAATAELKTRLRARLDEALDVLLDSITHNSTPETLHSHCSDVFLQQLLQQAWYKESSHIEVTDMLPKNPDDAVSGSLSHAQIRARQKLILRLKAAISDFDRAAVYTIHGFCQRVLQDFAFYCQVPFQIELDENNSPTYRLHATEDFWRTRIVHDADSAPLMYKTKQTPQNQIATLETHLGRPYLTFRQPEITQSLSELRTQFQRMWQNVQAKLSETEAAFWRLHPTLNGRTFTEKTIRNKFAQLATLSGSPDAAELRLILQKDKTTFSAYFAAERLRDGVKKNNVLDETQLAHIKPLETLYQAAEQLLLAEQNHIIKLDQDLLLHLRQAHETHKKSHPERRFDDLLLDVFHALQHNAAHAQALANAMSANWHTALIDEFQDTDPLQYSVFRTAFGTAAECENGKALFLVGDPKQAIYSFRGADIFAYLSAAQHAPVSQRYTLAHNHRSHAKLINSISALFSRNAPFVLPEIDYPKVQAAREHTHMQPTQTAINIRWLNDGENPETSETLSRRAADWCAAEIAHLLASGTQKIAGKPIQAGQIAVLVRANKDGRTIQNALKKQGVQSVLTSRSSIFNEEEAQALYALLGLMLNPNQQGLLAFLLSGSLFQHTASELTEITQNSTLSDEWHNSIMQAAEMWQQHGIYAALQSFFVRHQVEYRLLTQERERTLTNLHQLWELLANEENQLPSRPALYQWLGNQIQAANEGKNAGDHALLRLESDENLVKIVTMHASKGLQYPIVYCPYVWQGGQDGSQKDWCIVHQTNGQTELLHQKQLSDADREQINRETLSEDLRLLYVALTRAEEQLNLYLASYNKSNSNAFAYLLDCQEHAKDNAAFQAAWQQFIAQQDPQQTSFALHHGLQLPTLSGSLNNNDTQPIYHAQTYPPRHFQHISHTSFTGLSRQISRHNENTLSDIAPTLDTAELALNNAIMLPENHSGNLNPIFTFPQGAKAGVCLHEILEHYRAHHNSDFQAAQATQILKKHGQDPEIWLDTILQMAHNTVQTPLSPQLNIAHLAEHNRLDEMGFLFHSTDFKVQNLHAWFAHQNTLPENIRQAAQSLSFHHIQGFISGFMDLFVHTDKGQTFVIDYKSNHLGKHPNDYTRNALDQEIIKHHYYLQAFIYAIAAARYLKSRQALPETINIRYLFLRGLDGISNNGVWAWDIKTVDLSEWLPEN